MSFPEADALLKEEDEFRNKVNALEKDSWGAAESVRVTLLKNRVAFAALEPK